MDWDRTSGRVTEYVPASHAFCARFNGKTRSKGKMSKIFTKQSLGLFAYPAKLA